MPLNKETKLLIEINSLFDYSWINYFFTKTVIIYEWNQNITMYKLFVLDRI